MATSAIGALGEKIIEAHKINGKTSAPPLQVVSSIPGQPTREGVPTKDFGSYGSRVERERLEAWINESVKNAQRGLKTEVVTLTPLLARLLLLRNDADQDGKDGNRKISSIAINRYKHDLEQKQWKANGASIVISKDGRLNDGQHRCWAVIESGIPMTGVVIVFGAERDSRYTLDQGLIRQSRHYLQMRGYPNAVLLGVVAGWVDSFNTRGRLPDSPAEHPTKADVLSCVEENPALHESAAFGYTRSLLDLAPASVMAFCHFLFSRRTSSSTVESFFMQLANGAELKRTSPILAARNRLIGMEKYRASKRRRAPHSTQIEILIRAWNAWRKDVAMPEIRISGTWPKLER